MARITINVDKGTSRALLAASAESGSTHYEVVFKSGSALYGIEFDNGDLAVDRTIIIPLGNYGAGSNDALIFAGTAGRILLGVGEISTADGGGGAKEITPSTQNVTFTLTPLQTAVTTNKATSKFLITGPNGDNVNNWNYVTSSTPNADADIPSANAGIAVVGGFPVFPIPGTVSGSGYTGAPAITATYDFIIPFGDRVVTNGVWGVTDITTTVPTLPEGAKTGTITCTGTNPAPAAGTALALNANTFTFNINVSACTANGLAAIAIDVPVCILSNSLTFTTGSRHTWNIKGGTSATTIDDGTTTGSAVVLAVGTHAAFTVPVIIGDPSAVGW
jgi:hypothetical protein